MPVRAFEHLAEELHPAPADAGKLGGAALRLDEVRAQRHPALAKLAGQAGGAEDMAGPRAPVGSDAKSCSRTLRRLTLSVEQTAAVRAAVVFDGEPLSAVSVYILPPEPV